MSKPIRNEEITVGLGDRSYVVHVGSGLLERAGALIAPLTKRPQIVVVSDETVNKAQGERLLSGLREAGLAPSTIVLPPGEATKSFAQLQALLSDLLDAGVERNDIIVAFGGGVIGDLVGFAAAILRRGCRFVQIPTSLLAQVDSSVGGKTGINVAQGKNLIGAFHQPALVIADIDVLGTLTPRDLRAGYAEVVKYAAIGDAAFFDRLEEIGPAVLAGDRAARAEVVAYSVRAKASVVAADEREAGKRALLNLGHTFGHALEALGGYDGRLLHGEAVAAGMGLAFDYSVQAAGCPPGDAERLKAHLSVSGLPADIADTPVSHMANADNMMAAMAQDKKVEAGALTLILAHALGDAFIERGVDRAPLEAFLREKTA
ncbi:MAG: 3-dehydroquinate synthase [Pseudomonadota bacterium]